MNIGKLRVIGDVHGKIVQYSRICRQAEKEGIKTLQIGDFGWSTHWAVIHESGLNNKNHKFLGGNHDDYEIYHQNKYGIGDFGYYHHGIDFFFMRGGFSVDYKNRLAGMDWFVNEQLNPVELSTAISAYEKMKPRIMFSHEAPRSIAKLCGRPNVLRMFGYDPDTFTTDTSEALQTMFEIHQPETWIFCHYHRPWKDTINGCEFRCLEELEYVDVIDMY